MSDARVYLLTTREEWDVDGPDYVVGVYESEADAARVAQRLEDLNEDTDEWERLSVSIRSAPFHPTPSLDTAPHLARDPGDDPKEETR